MCYCFAHINVRSWLPKNYYNLTRYFTTDFTTTKKGMYLPIHIFLLRNLYKLKGQTKWWTTLGQMKSVTMDKSYEKNKI